MLSRALQYVDVAGKALVLLAPIVYCWWCYPVWLVWLIERPIIGPVVLHVLRRL